MAKGILAKGHVSRKTGRWFQVNPQREIYFEIAAVVVPLFPKLFLGALTLNGNRWLHIMVEPGHYVRCHKVSDIVDFEITGLTSRFEQFLDRAYDRYSAWRAAH